MIEQDVQRLLDQCKAIKPNPCAGCAAFNHAEKCATMKPVNCKLNKGA